MASTDWFIARPLKGLTQQPFRVKFRQGLTGLPLALILPVLLTFSPAAGALNDENVDVAPVSVSSIVSNADLRDIAKSRAGAFRKITPSQVSFVDTGFALEDVQAQLEASLGVPLLLTAGASSVRYRGTVSGETGLAFIEELATKLNLEWAIGRSSVYLAPGGTNRSRGFDVPSVEIGYRVVDLARRNFDGLGSNIRVTMRQGQVNVNGIPLWVEQFAERIMPDLIAIALDEADPAAQAPPGTAFRFTGARSSLLGTDEQLQVMVFRLNNAYVDDKQISVGSNAVTFPGVATLFSQFTGMTVGGGTTTQSIRTAQRQSRVPRMDPLAGERRLYWEESDETVADASTSDAVIPAPIDGPSVIADPRTNSLIVRDKPSMLGPYTELIKILDRPVEMVQLDAFVIDIKESRFNEFGLALSWSDASWTSPNVAPGGVVPESANLILQATQGAQLLAQIRALESEGDSQVLTVPSVVTQNNLEASFSARESFYVKVEGNLDASLNEVTAETLLSVTPLVEQLADIDVNSSAKNALNRRIRLLINIQDGSVAATDSQVMESLPRTLENQITTQAVVRGGETLIIGGQVVRKEISAESGLPVIRDLPLLGTLTNSRTTRFEKYVRVYVVRPKILLDNTLTANGSSAPKASLSAPDDEEAQLSPQPEPMTNVDTLPSIATEAPTEWAGYTEADVVSEVAQANNQDTTDENGDDYRRVHAVEKIAEDDIKAALESATHPESASASDPAPEAESPSSDTPSPADPATEYVHQEKSIAPSDAVPIDGTPVEETVIDADTSTDAATEIDADSRSVAGLDTAVRQQADTDMTSDELGDELYGPVDAGETLWSIASRLTFSNISVQRMMIGLKRQNPEAFLDDDINQIIEGSVLQIPVISMLLSISQEDALAEMEGR
ncbi:MAG: FimV/HubP family polar landmark protein [Gammaproteobacteria bacterium]